MHTREVNTYDFKTNFSAYVATLKAGEYDNITAMNRNEPVGEFKLTANQYSAEQFHCRALQDNYLFLSYTAEDAELITGLPLHYRDLFDHMLIAQAMNNDMMFVSTDSIMNKHNIKLLQE